MQNKLADFAVRFVNFAVHIEISGNKAAISEEFTISPNDEIYIRVIYVQVTTLFLSVSLIVQHVY